MIPSTLKKKIRLFEKGAKEGKKRKKKKRTAQRGGFHRAPATRPELTRDGEIGFPPLIAALFTGDRLPASGGGYRDPTLCSGGGMASVSLLVGPWPKVLLSLFRRRAQWRCSLPLSATISSPRYVLRHASAFPFLSRLG